jgi:hypothetical protein
MILALTAAATFASADLMDDFNSYASGSSLDGQGAAGGGWAGPWSSDGLALVTGSVDGTVAASHDGSGDSDLSSTRAWATMTMDEGDVYWYSMDLFSSNYSPSGDNDIFFSLFEDGVWGPGFRLRDGSLAAYTDPFTVGSGVALTDAEVQTVVGKVTFLANDEVLSEVWLNPGTMQPGGSPDSQQQGALNGRAGVQAFGLKVDQALAVQIDNLNITPEPATLALLGLGAIGMIRRRSRA